MNPYKFTLFCLLSPVLGCASTPGASPAERVAAQHPGTPAVDPRGVAQLQAQVDASEADDIWRSDSATTAAYVQQLRNTAASQRATSQALRNAEATACAGLGDRDRDVSPFAHREDIASVQPLNETEGVSEAPETHMAGAVVSFRALRGMTAPYLQRVVECHLARDAALGRDVPESAWCPLVPSGVTARVTATPAGFDVAVRSDDHATAKEVLRRARSLASS
jgi:hypothetical protein